MKMLRFEVCEDDELLLRGNSTPLESIRSCELAVECWNLRNSIAEADESFHNTKKDLKMQKYTLRRVQSDLQLLLKSMRAKDSQLQAKDDEITKLKTLEQKWNSSRSFFINSISKLEHSHEETLSSHSRLDSENKTLKLQL
jgi:DNA repair ATPase RecN